MVLTSKLSKPNAHKSQKKNQSFGGKIGFFSIQKNPSTRRRAFSLCYLPQCLDKAPGPASLKLMGLPAEALAQAG